MKYFKESKEMKKLPTTSWAPINIIVLVKAGLATMLCVPDTILMTFWGRWVNIYTVLQEKVTWKLLMELGFAILVLHI